MTSLGDNGWYFLASFYYFMKEVGDKKTNKKIVKAIRGSYPYICTCREESNYWASEMGSNPEVAGMMSACSEEGQEEAAKNTVKAAVKDQWKKWDAADGTGAAGDMTSMTKD